MSWFRKQAHRIAMRVAVSTGGDAWYRVDSDLGTRYLRRRGVDLPDMDALSSMHEKLAHRNGGPVHASAVGLNGGSYEPDDAADRIAHLGAPADRSVVSFFGDRADLEWRDADPGKQLIPRWEVDLRPVPGSSIQIHEFGIKGREFCEALIEIIERHVVDASRGSTEKSALVEPISLEDASQRAHDARVASKAARIGGRWGLAGGVIGGALSGWLAGVLTKAG